MRDRHSQGRWRTWESQHARGLLLSHEIPHFASKVGDDVLEVQLKTRQIYDKTN